MSRRNKVIHSTSNALANESTSFIQFSRCCGERNKQKPLRIAKSARLFRQRWFVALPHLMYCKPTSVSQLTLRTYLHQSAGTRRRSSAAASAAATPQLQQQHASLTVALGRLLACDMGVRLRALVRKNVRTLRYR
jgi:hypothetical protein